MSEELADALRPAARQAHDDLATYLAELVLALFDEGLQGPLEPFRALADPTTVRRALLAQMWYVADVAASLPHSGVTVSRGVASVKKDGLGSTSRLIRQLA